MEIHEIENLSFGELKARRDELVEAAKKVPAEDLAKRYVQARTDAKHRDEKLAEQATTLDMLKKGLAASEELNTLYAGKIARQDQALDDLQEKHNSACEHMAGEIGKALEKASGLSNALTDEKARSARLKTKADRYDQAMSSIQKMSHDAMSLQANEDADQGE